MEREIRHNPKSGRFVEVGMNGDKLFTYLLFIYSQSSSPSEPVFSSLKNEEHIWVDITTDGLGWDGSIDARGALFIKEIQDVINKIFIEVLKKPDDVPSIKVMVRDGSNILSFDLSPLIKQSIKKLTPDQIMIMLAILMSYGFGYLIFSEHLQHEERILAEKNRHEEVMAQKEEREAWLETLRELLQNNLTSEDDYLIPLRHYTDSLSDNDTIKIGAHKAISAPAAQEILKSRPQPSSSLRPQ